MYHVISRKASIYNPSKISIGDSVIIDDFVFIMGGKRTFIDKFGHICSFTSITGGGSLSLPHTYSLLCAHQEHAIVGANTVILPGVTIGEGVAIGANSLVKKDCKPWTIYVGSPAEELRSRPRERILQLETQLRRELYDSNQNYIPKQKRGKVKND